MQKSTPNTCKLFWIGSEGTSCMQSLQVSVLAQRSFFSRPHPIRKRSSHGPQQGARRSEMEITNFSYGDSEFSRISGLLPPIYPRFLQNFKAHDKAPSEGSKIQLDFRL